MITTGCYLISLLVLSIVADASQAQPSEERVVSGVVLDSTRTPIAKALVTAVRTDVAAAGTLSWAPADERGRFKLRLKPGKYEIRAKVEAEGYPDPNLLLSADPSAKFPAVLVQDDDVQGVIVVLGGKGGAIMGELRDARTNATIAGGKVVIRDARDSKAFVELTTDKAGRFQFTVPSKPLLISAVAPGYSTTPVQDGAEVMLAPGQTLELTIQLDPK